MGDKRDLNELYREFKRLKQREDMNTWLIMFIALVLAVMAWRVTH